MRSLILFASLLLAGQAWAQVPIFEPTMTITSIGLVDSPIGEEVDKIIDGTTGTKFLDFELDDGMGFTVELGFSAIATQIEIWTANDFPVRDPMNFEVLGSNDGSSFVSIDTGTLDCIPDRFFSRLIPLKNTIDFQYYQINFTNACDPSGGAGIPSIQLSEVQLYGEVLSTADLSLSEGVKIYPNPVTDYFTVDYAGADPITRMELFDMQGRQMGAVESNDPSAMIRIDMAQFPTGVYFVKIHTDRASTVKRVIRK